MLSAISTSGKLMAMVGCALCGLLLFASWSFSTLEKVKVTGPIYHQIVDNKDLVADVLPPPLYITELYLNTLLLLHADDGQERAKLRVTAERMIADYNTRHTFWAEKLEPGPLRSALVERADREAAQFFELRAQHFLPALDRGDHTEADRIYREELTPCFDRHLSAIQEVVQLASTRTQTVEQHTAAVLSSENQGMIALCLMTGFLLIMISWRVGGSIVTPLQQTMEVLEAVDRGDYGRTLHIQQRDEVGRMASALNSVMSNINGRVQQLLHGLQLAAKGDLRHDVRLSGADPLSRMGQHLQQLTLSLRSSIGEIAVNADDLARASEELRSLGKQMEKGSVDSAQKASGVVHSSSRVNDVVTQVAGATEELSASIREIAGASRAAGAVVDQAVKASSRSTEVISRLQQRNQEIGSVLSTITSLARQTNLLALNAGIEAGRAGELGRTFLVVANEVKDLSRSTTQAAEGIAHKLGAMQTDVQETVSTVSEVVKLIEQIDTHQQQIAASVTQQSMAVNEIAQQMSSAAEECDDIRECLAGFQRNLQATHQQTRDMAQASEHLSQMSLALSGLVQRFQVQ